MNTKEKVLVHRGMDKVRKKQFEEALEIFDQVLTKNPDIAEVWNNRGVALYGLSRWQEALQSYDRCLALDTENLDALRNKGFLLRGQRKLEEALQVYDSVLQKGGDAYDLESTAAVLTALGRLEEALNCLYLAREQMPLERLEDEIGVIKGLIEQRR
jgi:tetratricopeptide (TPR) repeat protein